MLPVVPPFLIGMITASVVKRLGKPVLRGIVKTSVGLGIEVKKAVHEAGQGIQGLAAVATAEVLAAQMTQGTEHGTGSAPEAAAARGGSESKAAGKARGTGSATAKVH
ncbi:DUF5132 domain-containing protein [Streptomyces sp. NPDC002623]